MAHLREPGIEVWLEPRLPRDRSIWIRLEPDRRTRLLQVIVEMALEAEPRLKSVSIW
jgi:hypothetical protein